MAAIGRPRLTEDDLRRRVDEYCAKYDAPRNPEGFPVFPAGKRETPQHRAWLGLYKARQRLQRASPVVVKG